MKQDLSKEGEETTTINVRKSTRDRLRRLGNMNDTYDDVIDRMADMYEKERGKK